MHSHNGLVLNNYSNDYTNEYDMQIVKMVRRYSVARIRAQIDSVNTNNFVNNFC